MCVLVLCDFFNSDVKFIVGEERRHIFAHRCILVSRCEVFRAMFADKMVKESGKEVPLVLSDVEPEIFMVVLEFIYTNCASINGKTVSCYSNLTSSFFLKVPVVIWHTCTLQSIVVFIEENFPSN